MAGESCKILGVSDCDMKGYWHGYDRSRTYAGHSYSSSSGHSYYITIIKFKMPMSGNLKRLTLKMNGIKGDTGSYCSENVRLNVAISTSDANKNNYKVGSDNAPSDSYRIFSSTGNGSGGFLMTKLTNTFKTFQTSYDTGINVKDTQTYYLILYANNNASNLNYYCQLENFNIYVDIYPSDTYIYNSSTWKKAETFVYTNGAWKKAIPYVYKDGSWHSC